MSDDGIPSAAGWSFRYYMEPVGKSDDNFHLFGGPEGDPGGTILEGAFTFPGNHSDALKYARLIAAAPELLSAAELALGFIRMIQEEEGFSPSSSVPAAALSAAIAKALGQ